MREQRAVGRGRRKPVMALVVGVATILGAGTAAWAQAPKFGVVGLASGQSAVLNLVLVDQPNVNHPGCRVMASFVDERGQVFVDSRGNAVSRRFTLQPQIASSITLSADLLTDGKQRRRIRPVVALVPTTTPSNCTCLMTNMEIANADGRTALVDYGIVETPDVVALAQPRDPCSPPAP